MSATRPVSAADAAVWDLAATVADPEVPVLTLEDLGILRSASATPDGAVVEITPTYSGCPAVGRMRDDVTDVLREAGYRDVQVRVVLSPAWTTDWMSEDGKRKLREYGIAPPIGRAAEQRIAISDIGRGVPPGKVQLPAGPHCGSTDVRLTSQFGSTPCKALYTCTSCREPFDHFKGH